jgi:serpin B
MKNGMRSLWLISLIVIALSACGAQGPDSVDPGPSDPARTQTGDGPVARSDALRDTSPDVPPADLAELAAGNADFAMAVYHRLRLDPDQVGPEDNLFISPYSISVALAMTYAGARNGTETEIAEALRYNLPQARLHPAFNALDLALESRGQGALAADGKAFRLHTANALWAQLGLPFLVDYLDTLAVNYDAGVRLVDYVADAEAARQLINAWVSEATEERIPELIGQGQVTDATRLVLTNTIYFNAAWEQEFAPDATYDDSFTTLGGAPVTVPMMVAPMGSFPYVAGEGYEAVELPYDGEELSMVVVLPAAGRFGEVEAALDGAELIAICDGLAPAAVSLSLPRWGTRSKLGLNQALVDLGMPEAFSGMADFSGITGNRDLFITGVLHEAFVTVDEAGTEAGAATAVIMAGGMPDTIVFHADRPFIFFIRDRATNAILFVGRVLNPAAS